MKQIKNRSIKILAADSCNYHLILFFSFKEHAGMTLIIGLSEYHHEAWRYTKPYK